MFLHLNSLLCDGDDASMDLHEEVNNHLSSDDGSVVVHNASQHATSAEDGELVENNGDLNEHLGKHLEDRSMTPSGWRLLRLH